MTSTPNAAEFAAVLKRDGLGEPASTLAPLAREQKEIPLGSDDDFDYSDDESDTIFVEDPSSEEGFFGRGEPVKLVAGLRIKRLVKVKNEEKPRKGKPSKPTGGTRVRRPDEK